MELIAADPGDGIAITCGRLQSSRRHDDDLIADFMSESIIDVLELVQIDLNQRQFAPVLIDIAYGFAEPLS